MRVALGLGYDGARFSGWQTQPAARNVQDTLEAALAAIAGHAVATVCAGRTDAGVHATGQVVHFDTDARRPDTAWVRGVNASLPDDVAVRWALPVPNDFHARFAATARTYRYLLLQSPARSPLWHGRAGWSARPLDVSAMRQAAATLIGTHDFSAFRSSQCQAASPVRTLDRLDLEDRGGLLVLTVRANAFLHHMVRNIVGALVAVGLARRPPDWTAALLASRDRTQGAATFSPAGLYLVDVAYPDRFALPTVRTPWPGDLIVP